MKKNKNLYDFETEKKTKKLNKKVDEKSNHNTLDNEIIIGVTMYPEKNNNKLEKKEKKVKTKKIITEKPKHSQKVIKKNDEPKKQKNKRKINKYIKWTSFIVIILSCILFAMLSPMFNISEIVVSGNDYISTSKIITLAEIKQNENIFRINKKEITNKIKQNGYIDNIVIKRTLPNKINLQVTERVPTFQIEYGSGYVYINNQGYILEVANIKKELPIIKGISTPNENFIEANRLNDEDLKKLNIVLKIVNVAKVDEISELITSIDITDENNYQIYMEKEKKTIYLGDASNIETRMLYVTSILKNESGKAGEIFVDMNLNTEEPRFRESVKQ